MSEVKRTLLGEVQTTFLRGLAVLMPVVFTILLLDVLLNAIDGILSPVLEKILGRQIPGLGFASMVVLIFVVGLLARNLIGRLLFQWFERLVSSIPFVRAVYGAIKDLISALSIGEKGKSFRSVVLVEYPRQGLYTVGFATNESSYEAKGHKKRNFVNVYIPNPPNPTSGVLILVPREQVVQLSLTVEQGLKLVLSGGIVVPGTLTPKQPST